MAEKNKPLTDVASNLSPGVATAAAQAKLSKSEQQQLAAFGELKKTHQYLLSLPQNDAYRNLSLLHLTISQHLQLTLVQSIKLKIKGFLVIF
jgi:hypothetical protein